MGAIISNIIVPIIKTVFIGIVICLWIYGIWYMIKSFIPKTTRSWFKYKIFRRNYKESDVKWCSSAVDKKLKDVDVIKAIRLNQVSEKRLWELVFIYRQIRELEGGNINDAEQIKENTLKPI